MSFIDEVREYNQDLVRVLKKHKGIRRIVEDLYPDNAHFIYELLQNAEDTQATEVEFILNKDSLVFEHNGRPFTESDVRGITDIGEGTKFEDEDKIGRFGIGFKAVFAYTENPYIWSPTFSFKISELVLPFEIDPNPNFDHKTRFEFPFNNPKKSVLVAHSEVKQGLEKLAETTLLFLSNIRSIRWQDGKSRVEIERVPHSNSHIEIKKRLGGVTKSTSHFLRFTEPVTGLEKQSVAIAFELIFLPDVESFNPKISLAKQLKIVPADLGRVAVFFLAEKETSGLHFHLHAPFVPELSRSSIKDTPANEPLFEQLTNLSASILHKIRDLGLLTTEFLSVLPNSQDMIPERYESIREAIIEEMNNEPLTPVFRSKSHAPAMNLLQAKASLKELLSKSDIEFLVEHEADSLEWAVGATQKNSRIDRFLSDLEIVEWDIEEFVKELEWRFSDGPGYFYSPQPMYVTEPDEGSVNWLREKSSEWHQQLYALLFRELSPDDECYRLDSARIVRLSDGSYCIGKKCFFPSESIKTDNVFPWVLEEVYTSGNSKTQQTSSKKLLEAIGVREVGEADQIKAILDQRYTLESDIPDDKIYLEDLKNFCDFVEGNPKSAGLFKENYIFKRANDDWSPPSSVYLDSPFLETGLASYYETLSTKAKLHPLSEWYLDCKIPLERIAKFAESIGVIKDLEIVETTCRDNPDWTYLSQVWGERFTSPINKDYTIIGLKDILSNPTIPLSRLVWRRMRKLPKYSNLFQATYQKNDSNGSRKADSQLVHLLRTHAWVPQTNGEFVVPADALGSLLPEGFPFDPSETWLAKIKFGANESLRAEIAKQKAEQEDRTEELAIKLGFEDIESLERAKRFASLPKEEQDQFLLEFERRRTNLFPENEPRNPELRGERVGTQAAEAPERIVEKRTRSVSVGRENVKSEAEEYLRHQYSNADEELFCQICKKPMPFRLNDGTFYFEKVEFLAELNLRHYQNYLALCPNHAAMYQYANGCEELIFDMFKELETTDLEVVLAQEDMTIRFTATHIADLKKVIEVDSTE